MSISALFFELAKRLFQSFCPSCVIDLCVNVSLHSNKIDE